MPSTTGLPNTKILSIKNEGIKIEQGRNSSNSPFFSILLRSVCVAVVAVAIRRRDASSCDVNII
jgi:hypothetical protein